MSIIDRIRDRGYQTTKEDLWDLGITDELVVRKIHRYYARKGLLFFIFGMLAATYFMFTLAGCFG
jgi:hypothetical protein